MIQFLDACGDYSAQVPLEVYMAFQIATPSDPKQGLASILFASSFELIADTELPGAGVLSWFLSGLQESYADPRTEPASLAAPFLNILERFDNNMTQMRYDLSVIHADPQSHLGDTYQIPWGPKKTITVAELGSYDFPSSEDPNFTLLIEAFRKAWKKTLTKNLLPTRYQIATIHYHYEDRPDPFEPEEDCWPENPKGSDANVSQFWSGGDVEISLCGDSGSRPRQSNVDGTGVNTLRAFQGTIAKIISANPAGCYVYEEVWDRPAPDLNRVWKGAYYWSYWLVPSGSYGKESFTLAPNDFVNWLFIDDGVGNVTNSNGVTSRLEVFQSWGLDGSEGVHVPGR